MGAVHLFALRALIDSVTAPKTHDDLFAWQEAMKLVEAVYRDTRGFPLKETFGFMAQMTHSAISVPSNLAEGAARNSRKELVQFVGISCGSLAELQTQLELSVRLGYLSADAESIRQAVRVGKLVRGLRKALKPAQA
jgi:four helix bundle protein